MTTDHGPDQQGAHTRISNDIAGDLQCLYFRNWCILHQLQLVTKKQLEQLASHFSEVATLVNLWRSIHNAIRIWRTWCEEFGRVRADQVCKKIPGKAISGRWGAVHASEKYLLDCGKSETQRVLPLAFPKSTKTKPRKRVTVLQAAVPAIAADIGGDGAVQDAHTNAVNVDDDGVAEKNQDSETAFAIVLDERKQYEAHVRMLLVLHSC